MELFWKTGFWAAILAVILRFTLPSFSIVIEPSIVKPIGLILILNLWSYALYKVFKAKGVLKKFWLLFLAIVFSALAGWVMYFLDHYAVNSDLKT